MSPAKIPERLRFVQFNVENLFLLMDLQEGQFNPKMTEAEWQSLSTANTPNKSLFKTKAIAQAIIDLDPDFVLLNEVGGRESLHNFNQYFLNDRYRVHIIEGNSDRGIDVGYLTRRDLPFKYLLISHRNRPIDLLYPKDHGTGEKNYFFSRDVAELRVFLPDAHSPCLVLLLTHLKSKLDPEGIDPEGKLRRQAELKALVKIYLDLRHELEGKVPILVAGDFNGEAGSLGREPEFDDLHTFTDLVDVFDLAQIPVDERATQLQFHRGSTTKKLHLDYIFASKELHAQIIAEETGVHIFKSEMGQNLPHPQTLEQRLSLPSDHYPVFTTINLLLASD